jgi:CubicO group peptidase (beta-lactamase class C family)
MRLPGNKSTSEPTRDGRGVHRRWAGPARDRGRRARRSRLWRRLLLAGTIAFAVACSSDSTGPVSGSTDLSHEWTTTSPAAVGLDEAGLEAAVQYAGTLPRLLSLLIVRHGQLAVEEYFNGNTRDSLNDVRSVTKSVVSTLTGIAVDRAALGVDSPIGPFLDSIAPSLPADKRAITVRNLLTMTSGFDWFESGAIGYNDWVLSGDPIHFLLDKPLVSTPGQSFNYNSAAVHLLSVVVQQATGVAIPDFAQENLFTPLGITRVRWEAFPDGRVNGGAGIDLRPRDLAKLGQLWLQTGRTGSRQVVDSRWIDAATQPTFPFVPTTDPVRQLSYGWLWWLAPPGAPTAFFAWGHGGQFIWVVPGLDAVIVVTTEWRNPPVPASELATNAMGLIVNHILPIFN